MNFDKYSTVYLRKYFMTITANAMAIEIKIRLTLEVKCFSQSMPKVLPGEARIRSLLFRHHDLKID